MLRSTKMGILYLEPFSSSAILYSVWSKDWWNAGIEAELEEDMFKVEGNGKKIKTEIKWSTSNKRGRSVLDLVAESC